MQKGTYDEEKGAWAEAAGTDGAKDDTAAFTNTFTKKGGSDVPDEKGDVTSLKVSKVVANVSYADLTKPFNFTIKFEADQNSPAQVPEQISHSGEVEDSWKAVEGEKNKYMFQLMYNGEISFTDLPAGIHYTVTEGTFANKKTTSNVATSNDIGKQNSGQTTGKLLVGEKTNSAEFTNTFKTITITGVVTHSAPFVIMVGALFVAVGGYVVLKKRIEE